MSTVLSLGNKQYNANPLEASPHDFNGFLPTFSAHTHQPIYWHDVRKFAKTMFAGQGKIVIFCPCPYKCKISITEYLMGGSSAPRVL